jgi:phage RecT family recombinase
MGTEITNQTTGEITNRSLNAEVKRLETQFLAALPPHIPVERFMRVVMTAINGNPDLQQADRLSLFDSAMKAAQDGLLPDGREGALVIFNTKDPVETRRQGKDVWIKKVQWMPMVAGIMKKARNSGQISTIVSRVVYAGDKFRNWIDDDGEHIEYEAADDQDRTMVRKVFAMAKLKDGAVEIEVLTPADVEKIRNASKAKAGPAWTVWWDEMARKSAIRRLSKRLPLSSDLDDLIRRDDDLYDFKGDRGEPSQRIGVANPMKEDVLPPADETKVIDHVDDDKFQGNLTKMNSAEFVVSRSGKVLKNRDGARPEAIVDQRFDAGDNGMGNVFTTFDEWITTCKEYSFSIDFGLEWPEPEASNEDDSQQSQGGRADGDKPATSEAAGASTGQAGSNAATTAKVAPAAAARAAAGPAYEQTSESYIDYMKDQFDKATSAAAIKDVWSKTRDDRKELLGVDEMETLEKERAAALDRIAKKAGM